MLKNVNWPSAWQEARQLIWERRSRLVLGLLILLINRSAGLVLPGSSKWLIDEVIANQRGELLPWLALAVGLATLLQTGTSFLLAHLLGLAAQRSITELRKKVQQHVIRLPADFFDSTNSGRLISRIMSDAEGIRNLVGTGIVQLVGGLLTATVGTLVLLYLNWRLTLIILVVLGLFGVGMAVAFLKIRPIFHERSKIQAAVTGRLSEALGGIRTVKAYRAERHEDLVFARGVHRLLRNVVRTIIGISSMTALATLLFGVVGVLMIMIGGRAILAGTMTLGDFVTYIFFTGMVSMPMVQIAGIGTQLTEAFAGLDRIRELTRLSREGDEAGDQQPVPTLQGDVEFDSVTFAYENGEPVVSNLTFTAKAGTTTALVGSSGAGKSTIISLLMGFRQPQEGRILVDGLDLSRLRLGEYRRQLGVVLQDNFLFDGTIAENIRYARPGCTSAELEDAARIAHCDEFIDRFEEGFNTVVGERGVKLSGGQRQRLAIARAILANPRLLILDEATSSLDSESEAMIQDGVQSLRKGRTTFVIAHRLSTIRSADQILVIEEGKLLEKGTHRELLSQGGRYSQLHNRQFHFEPDLFVNPGEDKQTETTQDEEMSDSESGLRGFSGGARRQMP